MEEDGSTDDSEALPCQPNRDKGHRHWDARGARQEMELSEQEPTQPLRTALKDSRVNFRLGMGGLQVKVDYGTDTAPKIPPPAPTATPSLPPSLTQRALMGEEEARAECLRLLGSVTSQEEIPKPPTIEYSAKEVEFVRTHLEAFDRHSREYMVEHGACEVLTHTPAQTV